MPLRMRLQRPKLAQSRALTRLTLLSQKSLQHLPPLLKLHHVPWSLCVAMTAQVKSAPKWPPLDVAVMASLAAASLATALAVTKALVLAVTAMAQLVLRAMAVTDLPHAVHVWVTPHSVRSVSPWSPHKTRCVAWQHKPMAKCSPS